MLRPLERGSVSFRAIGVTLAAVFLASILLSDFASLSYAQGAAEPPSGLAALTLASSLNLPSPNKLIELSPAYQPVSLRGLRFYPDDPFRLDFILDDGEVKPDQIKLKTEASVLIKYFLSSLTIPEEDLWVNLSPYEADKVVPEELGLTEMGKDLLAQDYLLKQLIASLTYPESPLGKEFWDRVYKQAYQLFGTSKIPINTFNKVWIVPDKAVIYEDKDRAILGEAKLKVMLEEDYQALKNSPQSTDHSPQQKIVLTEKDKRNINNFSSLLMKEIILPAIEKEVNEGKNFAQLRQIYRSLILAIWFKQKLKSQITQIKTTDYTDNILRKAYVDKKKIQGVDSPDPKVKEKVYSLYLEAYKNGLYNYIKKDFDPYERKQIKRRYYSGGADWTRASSAITTKPLTKPTLSLLAGILLSFTVFLNPVFNNSFADGKDKDPPFSKEESSRDDAAGLMKIFLNPNEDIPTRLSAVLKFNKLDFYDTRPLAVAYGNREKLLSILNEPGNDVDLLKTKAILLIYISRIKIDWIVSKEYFTLVKELIFNDHFRDSVGLPDVSFLRARIVGSLLLKGNDKLVKELLSSSDFSDRYYVLLVTVDRRGTDEALTMFKELLQSPLIPLKVKQSILKGLSEVAIGSEEKVAKKTYNFLGELLEGKLEDEIIKDVLYILTFDVPNYSDKAQEIDETPQKILLFAPRSNIFEYGKERKEVINNKKDLIIAMLKDPTKSFLVKKAGVYLLIRMAFERDEYLDILRGLRVELEKAYLTYPKEGKILGLLLYWMEMEAQMEEIGASYSYQIKDVSSHWWVLLDNHLGVLMNFSKIFSLDEKEKRSLLFKISLGTQAVKSYGNFNSDFFVGEGFIEKLRTYFDREINSSKINNVMEAVIAHELGHHYLRDRKVPSHNLNTMTIHEFIADLFAFSYLLGKGEKDSIEDFLRFLNAAGDSNQAILDDYTINEEHLASREQIVQIENALKSEGISLNWRKLLDIALEFLKDYENKEDYWKKEFKFSAFVKVIYGKYKEKSEKVNQIPEGAKISPDKEGIPPSFINPKPLDDESIRIISTEELLTIIGGFLLRHFRRRKGDTASSAVEKDLGLCLTPDSLITLADGTTKPLLRLKPFSHRVGVMGEEEGDRVLSLNEATGRLEPHRVLALLDMGVKPVYRLTTASGKSLKTTLTHPYRTPGGWKKLKNIKVGDEISVMKEAINYGAGEEVAAAKEDLSSAIGIFSGINSVNNNAITSKIKTDAILSDPESMGCGREVNQWFCKGQRVPGREIKLDFFNDAFLELEGKFSEFSFTGWGKLNFLNHQRLQANPNLCLIFSKGTSPNFFASSIPFLSFNTNLGFIGRRVSIASISQPTGLWNTYSLAETCSSSLTSKAQSKSHNEYVSKIKYFGESFLSTTTAALKSEGLMPAFISSLGIDANFSSASSLTGSFADNLTNDVDFIFTPPYNFKYNTLISGLSRLFSIPEAEASQIKETFSNNSDILWDKIVSIEPLGILPVYDIEVEGTHNFVAQGIVAHNTYSEESRLVPSTTGPAMRGSGQGLTKEQHKIVNAAILEHFPVPFQVVNGRMFEERDEDRVKLDPENQLKEIRIYVLNGLIERIRQLAKEQGVDPPEDLLAHPGLLRGNIYIDAKVFGELLSRSPRWKKKFIEHELAHIRNPTKTEEEIQSLAPLPSGIRPFVLKAPGSNSITPEERGRIEQLLEKLKGEGKIDNIIQLGGYNSEFESAKASVEVQNSQLKDNKAKLTFKHPVYINTVDFGELLGFPQQEGKTAFSNLLYAFGVQDAESETLTIYVTKAFYEQYLLKDKHLYASVLDSISAQAFLSIPEAEAAKRSQWYSNNFFNLSQFHLFFLNRLAEEGDVKTLKRFVAGHPNDSEDVFYNYAQQLFKQAPLLPVIYSTVGIETGAGRGSGFVAGEDDKAFYVLTAAHVVLDYKEVKVWSSIPIDAGIRRSSQPISAFADTLVVDENLDLAVVRVEKRLLEPGLKWKPFPLAGMDPNTLEGKPVSLVTVTPLQSPFPEMDYQNWARGMIVIERKIEKIKDDSETGQKHLQYQVPIAKLSEPENDKDRYNQYSKPTWPGVSGAPVVHQGMVVGMHVSKEQQRVSPVSDSYAIGSLGVPGSLIAEFLSKNNVPGIRIAEISEEKKIDPLNKWQKEISQTAEELRDALKALLSDPDVQQLNPSIEMQGAEGKQINITISAPQEKENAITIFLSRREVNYKPTYHIEIIAHGKEGVSLFYGGNQTNDVGKFLEIALSNLKQIKTQEVWRSWLVEASTVSPGEVVTEKTRGVVNIDQSKEDVKAFQKFVEELRTGTSFNTYVQGASIALKRLAGTEFAALCDALRGDIKHSVKLDSHTLFLLGEKLLNDLARRMAIAKRVKLAQNPIKADAPGKRAIAFIGALLNADVTDGLMVQDMKDAKWWAIYTKLGLQEQDDAAKLISKAYGELERKLNVEYSELPTRQQLKLLFQYLNTSSIEKVKEELVNLQREEPFQKPEGKANSPLEDKSKKAEEYTRRLLERNGYPKELYGGIKKLENPHAAADVIYGEEVEKCRIYFNEDWIDKLSGDLIERIAAHEVQHIKTFDLVKRGLKLEGLNNLEEFKKIQARIGGHYDKISKTEGNLPHTRKEYQAPAEALSRLRGYWVYLEQIKRGDEVTIRPREFIEAFNQEDLKFLDEAYLVNKITNKQDLGLCLTPDSLITLADGSQKPLIELKPFADLSGRIGVVGDGDMVLSLNEETQRLEPHRVLALLDMGVKPVYRITTASGKSLKTTLTHPYLTRDGWKKLSQIKAGEEVAVVYEESKNVLQNSLNLFYGKRREISQLLTDENLVYGNDFTYFNNRGLGKISLVDFPSTEKIFVCRDYFGDIRGNSYGDDIAVSCVKFAGRDDYRRPLFKSGKIRKRKRNENDISLFKGYHRGYLQDYSRSQKNSSLPLREEYHQGISLAVGVNPEGVVSAPQAVIEKSPFQPFLEHFFALSFPLHLKYTISSSLLSRLFSAQECQAAEIAAAATDKISWDKIISIEPLGPMPVYDIEVEATHNFVAQGIVAHNTYSQGTDKAGSPLEENVPQGEYRITDSKNRYLRSWGATTCVLVVLTDKNKVTALMHIDSVTDVKKIISEAIKEMELKNAKSENIEGMLIQSSISFRDTLTTLRETLENLKVSFKEYFGDVDVAVAAVTVDNNGNIIKGKLRTTKEARPFPDSGLVVDIASLSSFSIIIFFQRKGKRYWHDFGAREWKVTEIKDSQYNIREMTEEEKGEFKVMMMEENLFALPEIERKILETILNTLPPEDKKASSSLQDSKAPGGIDLNPANLNIEVIGETKGAHPQPFNSIPFDLQNFQGFSFQIISVQPADIWEDTKYFPV